MAEDKKGFILYADYEELFDELSDECAGKLIKHILKYVNDKNPVTDDAIVKVSFIPIKRQLKRDLEKYESKREQWSDAGKRSAESRRLKKEQALNNAPTDLTNVDSVATDLTVSVNVNDNVNAIRIPTLEDFMAWGLSKLEDVSRDALRLKYEAWKVDNWSVTRNGKTEAILNWKKTLNNTLVHLPKEPKQINTIDPLVEQAKKLQEQYGIK